MTAYSPTFFKNQKEGSSRSAREVIPIVLELIQPKRVVDVGCGIGTWLSVFQEHGLDILGIDGDWVDKKMLLIPREKFLSFDLKKPLRIDKQFDLVISLEVAEHLPNECAATFVDSLTKLGPVVLFSAAIPFQGGKDHVNEQWPEFWVKHFADRGYIVVDCIRKRIWNNANIEFWYAQNILLFVKKDYLKTNQQLQNEVKKNTGPLSIVHPRFYSPMAADYNLLVKVLPRPVIRLGKRILKFFIK